MDITTVSNIAFSGLSLVLVIVSVSVAVMTLRQNSRMIEASTRPYVVVRSEVSNWGSLRYYLIIKNYGQTGATIDRFTPLFDIGECAISQHHIPFIKTECMYLAPGQSIISAISYEGIKEKGPLEFELEYHAGRRNYSEKCSVNYDMYADTASSRAHINENELKIISYVLQDMAEKKM